MMIVFGFPFNTVGIGSTLILVSFVEVHECGTMKAFVGHG